MLLSQVLQGYWLANEQRLSRNTTARFYGMVFDRLSAFLGDPEFSSITADDLRRFLLHIERRGVTKRTVSDHWIPLSALWTWAESELSADHIVRKVRRPRYDDKPIVPLTMDEVKALVDAAEWTAPWSTRTGKKARSRRPTADRDRAMILTLLDTGVRASELCDLEVRDYDQDSGQLLIRHGKGDKRRHVYAGRRTRLALWRYLAGRSPRKTDPLFATKTGKPINRSNLLHTIQRIAAQAGILDVHPHRFRHTFAVNFIRNGGNAFALQKLLGHSDMATVLRYVRLAELDVREAVRKSSVVDHWDL